MPHGDTMNLNLYIARSGHCSRRRATLLIKEGGVSVNGKTVTTPWTQVGPGDHVRVSGSLLHAEKHHYVILNKPRGVTSTVADAHADRRVVDLVPAGLGRLYPVGRLDRMSRGLIILTNDGDLCNRLTHPRFGVEEEYVVVMRGRADSALLARLKKGAREGGDHLRVRAARILSAGDKRSTLAVTVNEGKKRHIRRLFGAVGAPVSDLLRVRIGALRLGSLQEGRCMVMDRETIYKKTLQKSRRECDNTSKKG